MAVKEGKREVIPRGGCQEFEKGGPGAKRKCSCPRDLATENLLFNPAGGGVCTVEVRPAIQRLLFFKQTHLTKRRKSRVQDVKNFNTGTRESADFYSQKRGDGLPLQEGQQGQWVGISTAPIYELCPK